MSSSTTSLKPVVVTSTAAATTTSMLFQCNLPDVVAFVHRCSSNSTADKTDMHGLLLIDEQLLLQATGLSTTATTSHHHQQQQQQDADTLSPTPRTTTVQAKLIGNLLFFWDCTLDVSELLVDVSLTRCVLLERAVIELMQPDAQYPYGIMLTFPCCAAAAAAATEDQQQQEQFFFSTFSEADRELWTAALSKASCELSQQMIKSCSVERGIMLLCSNKLTTIF